MSLAVGPYGIEYDPDRRDSGSPGLRRIVATVFVLSAVSLVVAVVRRTWTTPPDGPLPSESTAGRTVPGGQLPRPEPAGPAPAPSPELISDAEADSRPARVRNLLFRLEEAEKRRDTAMAVTTIEQICSLPGDPAHDLYDRLRRRAGELNLKWLFEERNAQWVSEVTAKAGDSATRIAARHGSTLASLKRLNPDLDVERLRIGEKVRVMNRPRFNLIVHARTRLADLKLNGRFFKRYDLRDEVTGAAGAYETAVPLRKFLGEKGVWFDRADRAELETLIPKGALLVISEL